MLLNIFIILAIGIIAFVHYIQGFFSATISAILAVVSALLAVSFYEPAVEMLLAGRFADQAHGMMLIVMFAVIYLVLRIAFDSMVPGNLRFSAVVDKVGGGAMGAIAGIFAVGVVAVAAQALPFSPNVGGYSPYAVLGNRPVSAPGVGGGRQQDAEIHNELRSDDSGKFDELDRQSLIVPVDDVLIDLVEQQSASGALARKPFTSIHPDLKQEYFGQRLGIQTGARRVIVHNEAKNRNAIQSVELYRLPSIKQIDFELPQFRGPQRAAKVPAELKPLPGKMILVARVMLGRDAGDPEDFIMRFSPGSVRLVAPASSGGEMTNYFPVGTIDKGQTLVANKLDDFLFVDLRAGDKGIDFAFMVDAGGVLAGSAADAKSATVAEGAFLEINRMTRVDLSGREVKPAGAYKPNEKIDVLRKGKPPAAQEVAPVAPPQDVLREKLVGSWAGATADGGTLLINFKEDGTLEFNLTAPGSQPRIDTGTWRVIREEQGNLIIERTFGNKPSEATVTFKSDDAVDMTTTTGTTTSLTRR